MNDINEDYLIKSGKVTVSELNGATTLLHQLMVIDGTDDAKKIYDSFLKPYNICLYKFSANSEYYWTVDVELPPAIFLQYPENDYSHISPSLRELNKNRSDIPRGYPPYFITAFPDVTLWCIKDGANIIKNIYGSFPSEKLINDEYFVREEILKDFVKLFQQHTNKTLECINPSIVAAVVEKENLNNARRKTDTVNAEIQNKEITTDLNVRHKGFNTIIESYKNNFIKDFGVRKFSDIETRVRTSNKVFKFIKATYHHKDIPDGNWIIRMLYSIPYFMIGRGQTLCVAALLILKRWDDEVNSKLFLLVDAKLISIAEDIIKECKQSYF